MTPAPNPSRSPHTDLPGGLPGRSGTSSRSLHASPARRGPRMAGAALTLLAATLGVGMMQLTPAAGGATVAAQTAACPTATVDISRIGVGPIGPLGAAPTAVPVVCQTAPVVVAQPQQPVQPAAAPVQPISPAQPVSPAGPLPAPAPQQQSPAGPLPGVAPASPGVPAPCAAPAAGAPALVDVSQIAVGPANVFLTSAVQARALQAACEGVAPAPADAAAGPAGPLPVGGSGLGPVLEGVGSLDLSGLTGSLPGSGETGTTGADGNGSGGFLDGVVVGPMPAPAPVTPAPAGVPAPVAPAAPIALPLPAGPELPPGGYGTCFTYTLVYGFGGWRSQSVPTTVYIEIEPGNRYALAAGEPGSYHYDDATGAITWLNGGLAGLEASLSVPTEGAYTIHIKIDDAGTVRTFRCPH